MTTRTSAPKPDDRSGWQRELARAIDSVDDLAAALSLPAASTAVGGDAVSGFPLRVPRGFVRRMRPGDPQDPLLRQVLTTTAELAARPGFVPDPLGESSRMRRPGLLQKYRGRALLILTGACAVNCRFCFRREYPYARASVTAVSINAVLDEITADTSLGEIILSGGDPLTLADERLRQVLAGLGRIAHVRRIRIHSRVPVVLPERIDAGLLAALSVAVQPVVLVLHANHANELDDEVAAAVARLSGSSAAVLNQSVLLRGVNDDAATLVALSERLFAIGVLPYYLHQLDRVSGTAHFRVGDRRARRIMGMVAAELPGYLVPRLVRESPGLPAKELIAPALHNRHQVT